MKFTFDENKINIFTLIPYGKMREDIVVKKCIESWKKIPNSAIYLFDMQDIKDTFPGMVENDKYYKILNNEYLKPGEEPTEKVQVYMSKWWIFDGPLQYVPDAKVIKKEQNISTDILRLKILQEIPNSVYCDSDIYIYDIEGFLRVFNDKRNVCYTDAWESSCCFCVNKRNKKDQKTGVLDKLISWYDKEPLQIDYSVYLSFTTRNRNDEIIKRFDKPYNSDKPYLSHLYSVKRLVRELANIHSDAVEKRKKIIVHVITFDEKKWFTGFLWNRNYNILKENAYHEYMKKFDEISKKDDIYHHILILDFGFVVVVNEENVGTNDCQSYYIADKIYPIDGLNNIYLLNNRYDFKKIILESIANKIIGYDRSLLADVIVHELVPCDENKNMKIIDIKEK